MPLSNTIIQFFEGKTSRIPIPGTDNVSGTRKPIHLNRPMAHEEELPGYLKDFEDEDLQRYTCFASEFRDQRMEAGSIHEAGFWNTIVNLCIDERLRRDQDIRRLEYMYRTGVDPHEE